MNHRGSTFMTLARATFVASGLLLAAAPALATEQGDQRKDARDTRQDKRDAKQEGRQDAREIKKQ